MKTTNNPTTTSLKQNLYTCGVTYDGYDWRNRVTVTSSTGRTIELTALYDDRVVSAGILEFFRYMDNAWRWASFNRGAQETSWVFTVDEMKELLLNSNVKRVGDTHKTWAEQRELIRLSEDNMWS